MLLSNVFLFIIFLSRSLTLSNDVDYFISPPTAAFFIHPSTKINNKKTSSILQQDFHVIDPFSDLQLGARLGSLITQKRVVLMADDGLHNATSAINMARLLHSSVHFVSYSIYAKEPVVRFLVHVQPDPSIELEGGAFCFHIFVKYGGTVAGGTGNYATTRCGILVDKDRRTLACHAAARLLWPAPAGLDSKNNHHLVARYTVSKVLTSSTITPPRCDPLSEHILAAVVENSGAHWLAVPGIVQLRDIDDNHQDSQLDRDVLLRFSNAQLRFGERFQVDVWLASYSKLTRFELRAESRDGSPLVFSRVIPRDPSWSVASEFHPKLSEGGHRLNYNLSVRCHIKEDFYHDSVESQRLLFSVEATILQANSGESMFESKSATRAEINWRLSPAVDRGNRSNRRMTLRGGTITLHKLDQGLRGLVPVVKRHHLFNLATLTNHVQYEKLRIFVLNRDYTPTEVTKSATCYITGNRMINVDLNCERLYFTGREVQPADAFNVTLLVKYQSEVVRYNLLRVYYPQRVMIHVDDKNLQIMNGWHISRNVSKELFILSKKRMIAESETEFASYWHQSNFESDDVNDNDDIDCQPTFQQTKLQIFARFSGGCSGLSACWLPKQVNQWFDVTHLAVPQLRTSGQGQVYINSDGRLQGIIGGTVWIQLNAPSGILLCKESVSVQTNSKVQIESISGRLFSAMSSSLAVDHHGLGSMQVYLRSTLRRFERGFVFTQINFDDGHSVALRHLNTTSYSLRLESLYEGLQVLPDLQSQVIVNRVALEHLNEDKRLLSVALSTTSCSAGSLSWKTRVTAHLLSGGGSEARFVERQLPADQQPQRIGHVADGSSDLTSSGSHGGSGPKGGLAVARSPGDSDGLGSSHARSRREKMSGLQIGMYCLLGFLSLALLIFGINCVIMFSRYRGSSFGRITPPVNSVPRLENESKSCATGEAAPVEEYADVNWIWLNTEQVRQRDSANVAPSNPVAVNKRYSATDSCRLSFVGQPLPLMRTTYQGHECSIRIVSNPLEASRPPPMFESNRAAPRFYDDEHLYYNHWDSSRQYRGGSDNAESLMPPAPPVRTTSSASNKDAACVSSPYLDRGLMRMTSEQLLLYFDNMQETVA